MSLKAGHGNKNDNNNNNNRSKKKKQDDEKAITVTRDVSVLYKRHANTHRRHNKIKYFRVNLLT